MSEETEVEPAAGGKLVAIKEETVEFTAGILGGVAGFVVGGPVLGAIGAATANYVSKMDNEATEVVGAVSKSALEVYNYLATLDNKYEVLGSAQSSLESALDKLKSQNQIDPAAIEKVENALASTKTKIEEVNDEYDLVGSGMTALGVVGDLVEKTIKKVGELNEEYELTDKAKTALSSAVEKAKDAATKA
jgi:phage-related minor tail protein